MSTLSGDAWDKEVRVLEQFGPDMEKKLKTEGKKKPKSAIAKVLSPEEEKAIELERIKQEKSEVLEIINNAPLSVGTMRAVRGLLAALSHVTIEPLAEPKQVTSAHST